MTALQAYAYGCLTFPLLLILAAFAMTYVDGSIDRTRVERVRAARREWWISLAGVIAIFGAAGAAIHWLL